MSEYLSPDVYAEEIDTGSKPVEGVSTSSAGVLGVTERGPRNVPILVTNAGDYRQLFGGLLERRVFGVHGYLPHAVDGFFRNGGRRLFVSRVTSAAAAVSSLTLFGRGEGVVPAPPAQSVLLRAAPQGTNALLALDATGLAANDRVRIGDGSGAEWPVIGAIAAAANHHMLSYPLTEAYPVAGTQVRTYTGAADTAAAVKGNHLLTQRAERGAEVLVVRAAPPIDLTTVDPAKRALELRRNEAPRELVRILAATRVAPDLFRITLARPLARTHPTDTTITVLNADPAIAAPASGPTTAPVAPGDPVIVTAVALAPGDIVEIRNGTRAEIRRVANPGRIGLLAATGVSFPRDSAIEHITLADAAGVAPTLVRDAQRDSRQITLSDRTGLLPGSVLRFGPAATPEFITVDRLPGLDPGAAPSGPGVVALVHGLGADHAAGSRVVPQAVTVTKAARGSTLMLPAAADATELLASETDGFNKAGTIQITDEAGLPHLFSVDPARVTAGTLQAVTLATPLAGNQAAGSTIVERGQLLRVEALDVGSWGDRLRIAIEDEESGLVARAFVTGTVAADRIRLSSLAGVEPGSVLELGPVGALIGPRLKVVQVNRADGSVTLAAALDAAQLAAVSAPGAHIPVRSREFRLTVLLMRRADPAVPTRNENIEATETFRHLSMDPRHSRYVETVIGRIGGPLRLWDRRPEGESQFIRVQDLGAPPAPVAPDPREAQRLGPEPLLDHLPSGLTRPARHPATGGDDGLGALSDFDYLGIDDREPQNRSGIHSLKNIDEISLVACPGITSVLVQQALVNHCEEMRYRFAVLDGPDPAADTIADAQALRQNYDTKHAALYYPWLTIPDPLPENLASVSQVPIPPSGHVIGVYARTDVERGVHKAPANEVVRGITGLRRVLNRAEHDLLNPSPTNINVIRDFRTENRAIRVWGARVITSDPDFKYVSVRRLLLFIEKSVERGLQWVVFEPNAEPLWARVRFSVESFLETVWRNGALEGEDREQAFFVKCDETTNPPAARDNGLLTVVAGVAAVKPAEFVIFRIGLKTAVAED